MKPWRGSTLRTETHRFRFKTWLWLADFLPRDLPFHIRVSCKYDLVISVFAKKKLVLATTTMVKWSGCSWRYRGLLFQISILRMKEDGLNFEGKPMHETTLERDLSVTSWWLHKQNKSALVAGTVTHCCTQEPTRVHQSAISILTTTNQAVMVRADWIHVNPLSSHLAQAQVLVHGTRASKLKP